MQCLPMLAYAQLGLGETVTGTFLASIGVLQWDCYWDMDPA